MIPVNFPEANATLAMSQEQYEPLAVYVDVRDPNGPMTVCFRLSDEETAEIIRTRTLWITALTFGGPFQPIALSVSKPNFDPPPSDRYARRSQRP